MSSRPRCVFDTNVVVSAALYGYGNPGQAFDWALDNCDVLLSDEVAQEVHEVLSREKFSRYITTQERELFLQRLVAETELIEVAIEIRECRDPKDNKFLELAVCGDASHIITGDGDLLELHPFRGIAVLPPREFLDSVVRTAEPQSDNQTNPADG